MTVYIFTDGGTVHLAGCSYLRPETPTQVVSLTQGPAALWQTMWDDYDASPSLWKSGSRRPALQVEGHAVRRCCLRCIQPAAVKAGWQGRTVTRAPRGGSE